MIDIKNKRAHFDYEFIDTYTAGIVLVGTEIKSLRLCRANLTDSFCYFNDGELFVKNIQIDEYEFGNKQNHEPKRDRKLLLKKTELNKIEPRIAEQGLTLIVSRLFINKAGLAKVEISIAKGKKEYDKRQSIKKKDIERDIRRELE